MQPAIVAFAQPRKRLWSGPGMADLTVDPAGANTGGISPGLLFGAGYPTGEGVSSNRSPGANQWGLDFYTGHACRLSITNTGGVGIGVTDPGAGARLGVAGNVVLDNTALFGFGNTGEWIMSERHAEQGDNLYGLSLATGHATRLTITNSGNVGIGTTTPGQTLTVQGVIESTVGGIKYPDGTVQTSATRIGIQGDKGRKGATGNQGPQGEAGIAKQSIAICGPNPCNLECAHVAASVSGPCVVTADSGSCEMFQGYCCVCM
ncbi:hypothetical protein ABH941_000739 [Streptacidiphilus sp. EB103A]